MADQNIRINLTATDQLTPTIASVLQQFLAFQQQVTTAGTNLTQLNTVMTQAQAQLQGLQQAAQGAGAGVQQNVQAYAQAIQAAQAQVAALVQAQGQQQAAAGGAAQATAQHAQALTQAAQAAGQLGTVFQGALSVAGGLGLATSVGAIVGEVKQLAVESVQLAIKMQALTASFTAITGSSAGAAHAVSFIRGIAVQTGNDFLTLAQSFKNFEAAARGTALEGTKAEQVFQAVSGAARVMGLSSTETGRALLALEQMVSKGTVSMEELRRQLGNALPGAFQIAARAMGTTSEGLQTLLKNGLDSSEFVTRFGAQLQREFGPRLAEAGQTAAATFGRLGNEVQATAASVGKDVLTILTPIASFLERTLRQVREANEQAQTRGKVAVGGLPEGGTEAQRQQLTGLGIDLEKFTREVPGVDPTTQRRREQQASQIREQIALIREQIQTKKDLDATFAKDIAPSPLPAVPFADQAKVMAKEVETMRAGIKAANIQFQVFPAMSQDKLQNAKDVLKVLETSMTKLTEQIAASKDKAPGLVLDQQKLLATLNQEYAVALANVTKLEAAKEAETEATRKAAQEARQAAREAERRGRDSAKLLAEMGIAARFADTMAAAGGDPEAERAARDAEEEATLRQTIAQKGLGAEVEATAVAFLRQKQAAEASAATITVMVKEQQERIQEFAKNVDIFGLNLTPDQEKARAFAQKIRDAVTALQAPREERPEARLRAQAAREGITPTPEDEAGLRQLTSIAVAQARAKEMDQIATRLAGNMRQTFDNLWEQVFTGGVTSFRQLGQVVAQSLQRMFAQLTAQIMSQLLNAMAGTTGEKGGWEGVLARGVVGLGASLFGGAAPAGVSDSSAAGLSGEGALFGAAGGGVFPHGLGAIHPLRMAAGGIVSTPSYTTLAEMGQPEAVVPLSGGRNIPVEMRGQSPQQQQPIVIHIVNDYTGAVSPSSLKTGKREIIQHIINDYRSDGPIRRTFKAG